MDGYSSDESVVTNTTMNTASFSPQRIFKGLNMLHASTANIEKTSEEERGCSPVIPSQMFTAPIRTSQLTEPLFSELTDDESSYSQSLLVTSTANDWSVPGDQDRHAGQTSNEMRPVHVSPNQFDVSKSSLIVTTKISQDVTKVSPNANTEVSPYTNTEVSPSVTTKRLTDGVESQSDSDATRQESDDQISPLLLESQAHHVAHTNNTTAVSHHVAHTNNTTDVSHDVAHTNNTTAVSHHVAHTNNTTDVSHDKLPTETRISSISFPSAQFTEMVKDNVSEDQTTLCDKDKIYSVPILDKKDNFKKKITCNKRVKISFIPPYKVCMPLNIHTNIAHQNTSDSDSSQLFINKAKVQNLLMEEEKCNRSIPNTDHGGHVSKCLIPSSHLSTAFKASSNGDTIEFSKPSQAMTAVNNVDYSQVSTMSSKSLFSSSVPSETQTSKPYDNVMDDEKVELPETKNQNMISHSLAGNPKTEDDGENPIKDCEIVYSVSDNTDVGKMSECKPTRKDKQLELSDDCVIKKCNDSSSARPDAKESVHDKTSNLNNSPIHKIQYSNFNVRPELGEIPVPSDNPSTKQSNGSVVSAGSNSNFMEFRFMETAKKSQSISSNRNNIYESSLTPCTTSTTGLVKEIAAKCKSGSSKSSSRSVTKSNRSGKCSESNTGSSVCTLSGAGKQVVVKHTGNLHKKALAAGEISKNCLSQCHLEPKTSSKSHERDKKSSVTEAQLKKTISQDKPSGNLSQESQSKEIKLTMLEQYSEILAALLNKGMDKTAFNFTTQKTKELQVKILKLSESHKHERTEMMTKLQKGSLSKSDKLQLKMDMQSLAERQKQLVEIFKKHKDINTKLKSISLSSLSGTISNDIVTSLEKYSNVSSSQMCSSSQHSSIHDMRVKLKVALEKLSGESKKTKEKEVMIGDQVKPTSNQLRSVNSSQTQQADFNNCKTPNAEVTQDIASPGSLMLDSAQNISELIKHVDTGPAFNKQAKINVDSNKQTHVRSSQSKSCNTKEVQGTFYEMTTNQSNIRAEKLQAKQVCEVTGVKSRGEIPSKISLCESSQRVLDDIFFTSTEHMSGMKSSQANTTAHRLNNHLVSVACGSQVITGNKVAADNSENQVKAGKKLNANVSENQVKAGKKLNANVSENQVKAGKKLNANVSENLANTGIKLNANVSGKNLDGMSHGVQFNAVNKSVSVTEIQVNTRKRLHGMDFGKDLNSMVKVYRHLEDSNTKQVVGGGLETRKDVQSTQTDRHEGKQKAEVKVLTADRMTEIDGRDVPIRLKKIQITDPTGKIIDVFVIDDPQDSNRPIVENFTAEKIQEKIIISKPLNNSTKNLMPVASVKENTSGAREINGGFYANVAVSEVKKKTEIPNETVNHDTQCKYSDKNNIQTPCSTGPVISPVFAKPSTFKSPPQISVISNQASSVTSTTSPCSTAVSSDVFPVSCTELVRRMKARRLHPCHAVTQRQHKDMFNTIPVIPRKKPVISIDSARSPCLKDLVQAGWVKQGLCVLSVNSKGGQICADITKTGLIRGSDGKIFRTPCAWMSAITGSMINKKLPVYQQIYYLKKPLSEYVTDMILSNRKTSPTSPAIRPTLKRTDSKVMPVQQSKAVELLSVKDPEPQSTSMSSCLDEVSVALLHRLHNCKVKLIDDAEIVHCPELTPEFWSSNFTNVKMSKNMWESVDCWS